MRECISSQLQVGQWLKPVVANAKTKTMNGVCKPHIREYTLQGETFKGSQFNHYEGNHVPT
jgi:hypothetical protein